VTVNGMSESRYLAGMRNVVPSRAAPCEQRWARIYKRLSSVNKENRFHI